MGAISKENRPVRRRARLAAVAVVALACSAAWGQPSFDATALRSVLTARGFTPAQTQAVLATLTRANARGLPASVLESRLREGLARHAKPGVIQRVLDDRLNDLARADDLVRRGSRQGIAARDREVSLTRLADSLAMGVRQEDVVSVLPAAASGKRDLDSVSRAAEVMGRLARQRSPAADTRDVLRAALAAGWTREQMDGLADVFATARRLGVAREKTRQSLAEGIRNGKGLDRLAEDVKAGAAAAAATPAAGRSRSGSAAASPRSGPSHSGSPKGMKGGTSPHGPRTPPRGVTRRAPAPRPHAPRVPVPRTPPPHR